MRMNWVIQGQYAPFYYALQEGYWEECGLNVVIRRGTGSADAARMVGSAADDFGITDAAALIPARAAGVPVRMLGIWHQTNPSSFVSLAENGLESPEDLEGLTFGAVPGGSPYALAGAFLADQGVTIEELHVPAPGYTPLLNGDVDFITSFATAIDAITDNADEDLNVIHFSDYGQDIYGLGLITHDAEIENDPEAVQCFVDGAYRGLTAAQEDPDAAMEALVALEPELANSADQERAMMDRTLPLYGEEILAQTAERWEETQSHLVAADIIEEPLPIDDLYTNEFPPTR